MYEPLLLEQVKEAVRESEDMDEEYHSRTRTQMLEEIKDLKRIDEERVEFHKKLSNQIEEKENKLKEKKLELAGQEKIMNQLGK